MIIRGKLLAKEQDFEGYITYIFENCESSNYLDKYIKCTQCPNWNTGIIEIGNEGFLEIEEHFPREDCWYNGVTMVPYKTHMVQFIKFIPITKKLDIQNITL